MSPRAAYQRDVGCILFQAACGDMVFQPLIGILYGFFHEHKAPPLSPASYKDMELPSDITEISVEPLSKMTGGEVHNEFQSIDEQKAVVHGEVSESVDKPVATKSRHPKRVALFTGAYNHIADGVSLTLNRLVDHLERQGVAVRVFAPTVDDPAIENHAGTLIPVPSLPLPGRPEYRLTLGMSPSVQRALEDFNPTLYHIAMPDPLGRHALSRAHATDTPVVASYHTHFSSYLKYYHLGFLETLMWDYLRRFYNQCHQVYVPTVAMAEVLRDHGISDGLRLWRRGVNTDRFTPARRSEAWRHTHGIDDDDVVVTFVSRLVREKGLDVYADVIECLERQNVPHHSLVVGDGPARKEMEARLPNTTFTGFLEGENLARAYASSDLFLFPSDTETFGNVTLEAMASGLPTICADAAGSRALVEDGTTGRLCPPGDVEAFTEATRALIVDDSLRDRLSAAAYRRAQDFTWSNVLSQMNRYYEEVLRSHASAKLGEFLKYKATVG